MSTEFHYKLLKLSNGENIVCTTDDNCENLKSKVSVYICDPVLVTPVRIPKGINIVETYIMTPWISISEEKIFEIPTDQIIVAANVKKYFIENYKSFIDSKDDLEKETPLLDREKSIKNFLKSISENENEETQETGIESILVPGTRSIH